MPKPRLDRLTGLTWFQPTPLTPLLLIKVNSIRRDLTITLAMILEGSRSKVEDPQLPRQAPARPTATSTPTSTPLHQKEPRVDARDAGSPTRILIKFVPKSNARVDIPYHLVKSCASTMTAIYLIRSSLGRFLPLSNLLFRL